MERVTNQDALINIYREVALKNLGALEELLVPYLGDKSVQKLHPLYQKAIVLHALSYTFQWSQPEFSDYVDETGVVRYSRQRMSSPVDDLRSSMGIPSTMEVLASVDTPLTNKHKMGGIRTRASTLARKATGQVRKKTI